jgi:hypothetical protein
MLIYQQVSASFNPNFVGALGVILLWCRSPWSSPTTGVDPSGEEGLS